MTLDVQQDSTGYDAECELCITESPTWRVITDRWTPLTAYYCDRCLEAILSPLEP